MYATCLFCNGALGSNEALEHFPVGRRIAYDEAKGRLWVVCRTCERWNLSPLETRWEAIDEAERAFRATKLRVSTENIGMAQLKDGLELVRIGKPIRAEFAAWRYGDQFGRRWRKYAVGSAAITAGPLAQTAAQLANIGSTYFFHFETAALLAATGVGMGLALTGLGFNITRRLRAKRLVAVVRDDTRFLLRLNQNSMDASMVIAPTNEEGWKLRLKYPKLYRSEAVWYVQGNEATRETTLESSVSTLTGDNALRALTTLLPHINRGGGSKRTVSDAVDSISQAHDLADILKRAPIKKPSTGIFSDNVPLTLSTIPAPTRLALEMSLHENDERRAMAGELQELEQRWRDADAIAKIADEMFLPEHVNEQMRALRANKPEAS